MCLRQSFHMGQVGFQLRDPAASVSQVLESKLCKSIPGSSFFWGGGGIITTFLPSFTSLQAFPCYLQLHGLLSINLVHTDTYLSMHIFLSIAC